MTDTKRQEERDRRTTAALTAVVARNLGRMPGGAARERYEADVAALMAHMPDEDDEDDEVVARIAALLMAAVWDSARVVLFAEHFDEPVVAQEAEDRIAQILALVQVILGEGFDAAGYLAERKRASFRVVK